MDAYIPDRKFRNRDPRFATQKRRQVRRFTLKDFHHDEALDRYICPQREGPETAGQTKVSTMGTFTANILLLKKIARIARSDHDAFMVKGAKRKQLSVPIGE